MGGSHSSALLIPWCLWLLHLDHDALKKMKATTSVLVRTLKGDFIDYVKDFFMFFLFKQAVINSTITPNMTFTKTSSKFGQWSDPRAGTVYGLGFSSENDLTKVRISSKCEVSLL
jgi:hypothetical protein